MFSAHMGEIVAGDGGPRLLVRRGATGHAIYGPYDHVRPGRFRIEFDLACPDADVAGDAIVAELDVAAYHGTGVLAARAIRRDELGGEPRTVALEIANRGFRSLEYRVHATGAARLLLGEPRAVRLGDVPDEEPAADPAVDVADPMELQRQVRRVLGLLRPHRAAGIAKLRLGHPGDGGYVMLDDFVGIDAALSFGISDDISWDGDAADRGMTIYQFDHTIDDPAPHDPRMVFTRKAVAPTASDGAVTLADLVARHDRGLARPNMLLKMDIEGAEWPMFEATPAPLLGRLSQIVCELHYFERLADLAGRQRLWACLSKLHEHFAVVHVHANICGGTSNIANVLIPNTLEISFANRAIYRLEESDETFPGPLDTSCDANQPDLWLGSFRF